MSTETTTECNGDKTLGYDFNAKCYSSGECNGCDVCTLKCPGCVNCAPRKLDRHLVVGDYVVVATKVDSAFGGKIKWNPEMDKAIGRVGWIRSGGPRKGFTVKFSPEVKELEGFVYPPASVRLANPEDVKTSEFIHTLKDQKDEDDA